MTEEELKNRLAFKKRMIQRGKLPLTDDFLIDEELNRQRTFGAFGERPEEFSEDEWLEAKLKRESFKSRMRAAGKLPKETETQKRATTLLLNETRLVEEMKKKGMAEEEQRKRIEELEAKLNDLVSKNNNTNEEQE